MEYSITSPLHAGSGQNGDVLDYYDALEMCVHPSRNLGCFYTHFGIMRREPDYCLIKAMMRPDEFPEHFGSMCMGMERLQSLIFSQHEFSSDQNILDIGCGVGGSMGRLAALQPGCLIEGVNLNRHQLTIAAKQLSPYRNTTLHYANILNWHSPRRYDLLYCLESAFHIEPKIALCDKIRELAASSATLIIVDVFLDAGLAVRKQRAGGVNHAIFNYLSVQQWCGMFPEFRLQNYINCTRDVTDSFMMTTTDAEYRAILDERLGAAEGEQRERLEQNMWDLFYSYRTLHRTLVRGRGQYGILVLRKE